MADSTKGWFSVPGIRERGDRTLDEQIDGVRPGLLMAPRKTVLDLGCAEALISREFALAGASRVLGIELIESHVKVARQVCADVPQVEIVHAHLADYMKAHPDPEQFDIVLALSVIHKMHHPRILLEYAARSAKNLLLFRPPIHAVGGVTKSKHSSKSCNVPNTLAAQGFYLEHVEPGCRNEPVQYWRRKGA